MVKTVAPTALHYVSFFSTKLSPRCGLFLVPISVYFDKFYQTDGL
jgi:hypothetical protein